jgi:hypothetical protein
VGFRDLFVHHSLFTVHRASSQQIGRELEASAVGSYVKREPERSEGSLQSRCRFSLPFCTPKFLVVKLNSKNWGVMGVHRRDAESAEMNLGIVEFRHLFLHCPLLPLICVICGWKVEEFGFSLLSRCFSAVFKEDVSMKSTACGTGG